MKKLDAATIGKIAPGAAMVLLATPVFLFMAVDLILVVALPRSGFKPEEVSSLAVEIVMCAFAGLVAAYGVRAIRRHLREAQ
jgi:hypothetical protein